jgi:hypothetical protein
MVSIDGVSDYCGRLMTINYRSPTIALWVEYRTCTSRTAKRPRASWVHLMWVSPRTTALRAYPMRPLRLPVPSVWQTV